MDNNILANQSIFETVPTFLPGPQGQLTLTYGKHQVTLTSTPGAYLYCQTQGYNGLFLRYTKIRDNVLLTLLHTKYAYDTFQFRTLTLAGVNNLRTGIQENAQQLVCLSAPMHISGRLVLAYTRPPDGSISEPYLYIDWQSTSEFTFTPRRSLLWFKPR